MNAIQGKYADAIEAFIHWLDEQNKQRSGSGGPDRASQAKGLVQLGDAYRGLGQVRQGFPSSSGDGESNLVS